MIDVVVAGCPNDVFVYLKEQSENIKKYIAPLSIRPKYGKRCWGTFHVFDNTIYADGLC
ncbi:hypothetical protein [Bacteroides bouchesdurhonensis]|uniref:hypothetical protein n=1 Tax=Bacteroides bouchesdurhonensis TaxID=1841855 RepID=UPI00135634B0|nr:hypothetical protein [Bacteroides bouchesdurhonensis]